MKLKPITLIVSLSIISLLACCKKEKQESFSININASETNINVGDTVIFNCSLSNNSYGICSFDWFFEEGVHINPSDPPPDTVIYNKAGIFDVKLTVKAQDGHYYSDTKLDFITVN